MIDAILFLGARVTSSVAKQYRHDCSTCHYLGSLKVESEDKDQNTGYFDFYRCSQRQVTSYLARYGSDGSEYFSYPDYVLRSTTETKNVVYELLRIICKIDDAEYKDKDSKYAMDVEGSAITFLVSPFADFETVACLSRVIEKLQDRFYGSVIQPSTLQAVIGYMDHLLKEQIQDIKARIAKNDLS